MSYIYVYDKRPIYTRDIKKCIIFMLYIQSDAGKYNVYHEIMR